MMTSIDRAGRVVIPKELRDRLERDVDTLLELVLERGSLRLTPVRPPGRRIVEVDGWPVIEAGGGDRLTDADVQRLRDADQR